MKERDGHKDLIEFGDRYKTRIESFLSSNPETRVIFLNADYGWGKQLL